MSKEDKLSWEWFVGAATIIGAIIAIATVKETRSFTCQVVANTFKFPLLCDVNTELAFQVFQYQESADGILSADACSPYINANKLLGEDDKVSITTSKNMAVCWYLKINHPQLSEELKVPAQIIIDTPETVYASKSSGEVARSIPNTPLASYEWFETRRLTQTAELSLSPGIASNVSHRLMLVGGDISQWPNGRYVITIIPQGLNTPSPIVGNFTLKSGER